MTRTIRTGLTQVTGALVLGSLSLLSVASDESTELARESLLEALAIIERDSIMGQSPDWAHLRARFERESTSISSSEDAHQHIRSLLDEVGDGHSFLMEPVDATRFSHGDDPAVTLPVGAWLSGRIAYLKVPGMPSAAPDAMRRYAVHTRGLITRYQRLRPAGWVIDLRGNPGGNLWPMLAGLAPLLGEGAHGYFIDADGEGSPWRIAADGVYDGGHLVLAVDGPIPRQHGSDRIAVLQDRGTLSSAEALALSFRGHENARTFGAPSGGLTTSNRNYTLPDGSVLFLATSWFADHDRQPQRTHITPDVAVPNVSEPAGWEDDAGIEAARAWLLAP